jgi:tripartite-type tricarboxylate transporter receptor subunit TctC
MVSRRKVLYAVPALAGLGMSRGALAQGPYPQQMIKIVIGNAPGGTDDTISRFVATKMAAELGKTVLVENRGGGSTTVAGSAVASSPPDGYTLFCLINAAIVQTVLRDKLRYGLNSFVPIVGVGGFPLALTVSTTTKPGISSLDELKAAAKSPTGVTFASGGVGTMGHLNALKFLNAIGGKGVHVPYKNNPEGLQAMAGGFTQMTFASASEVAALRGDGRLKVLAVTSEQRAVNLPDVPTMKELGFPSINTMLWHGYVAPAGTPPDIVAKLAASITKAVKDPEFQSRFKPLAFQEDIKTGEALSSLITAQAALWREVIVENKVQVTD